MKLLVLLLLCTVPVLADSGPKSNPSAKMQPEFVEFFARVERERQERKAERRKAVMKIPLTGALYQHIKETAPEYALFNPQAGSSASPEAEGNEIGDALLRFEDPAFAMHQLEALKREAGFTGGHIFSSFRFVNEGFVRATLVAECGISPSNSTTWQTLRKAAPAKLVLSNQSGYSKGDSEARGTFANFKLANRAERVQSIARCLASFPGMPELKKHGTTAIKTLKIDNATYGDGVAWLKSLDGNNGRFTVAQYRSLFECAVRKGATKINDGVSDTLVMRRFLNKSGGDWFEMGIAVLNSKAAEEIFKADSISDMEGIWPLKTALMKEYAFDDFKAYVPECQFKLGMITQPDAKALSLHAPAPSCETR